MYCETYRDLCHGTTEANAENIKENGFNYSKAENNWCGSGVYFYDNKAKAWWAANRKCDELRKIEGKKEKSALIMADIIDIPKTDIFDMRSYADMSEFEAFISPLLEQGTFSIDGVEDEVEKTICMRALLLGFFASEKRKKLLVGNFKQRPQKKYEHMLLFADSLDVVFGVETIYCVKDKDIIKNIRIKRRKKHDR